MNTKLSINQLLKISTIYELTTRNNRCTLSRYNVRHRVGGSGSPDSSRIQLGSSVRLHTRCMHGLHRRRDLELRLRRGFLRRNVIRRNGEARGYVCHHVTSSGVNSTRCCHRTWNRGFDVTLKQKEIKVSYGHHIAFSFTSATLFYRVRIMGFVILHIPNRYSMKISISNPAT